MTHTNIENSGTFLIGGTRPVHRLGYGAMRITGDGFWGPPKDREAAIRTLQVVAETGIDFIDTADSYGPDVSERLLREVLHPYDKMLIATKAGFARTGPDSWIPLGRPEYLIQQAHKSLLQLDVSCIDLWQLHRIDPKVPRDEQFSAVKSLLDDGLVRYVGLSEVSVADIQEAQKYFPVATVQNRYNLAYRGCEDVLEFCEAEKIGFIPWFPLASGDLAKPGSVLESTAKKYGASNSQVALAWMLKRSPVMLPIPGTCNPEHLRENVAAADLVLSEEDFTALDVASSAA